MRQWRSFLPLAMLIAFLAACGSNTPTGPGPINLRETVPLDSIRALPVGTEMLIRTDIGKGPEDFQVTLVEVVDDLLPPLAFMMLKATDPRLIELGGAAAGMSGSPVIWQGKIAGALSYAFAYQTRPSYYFFATPIEAMTHEIERKTLVRPKPLLYHGNAVIPLPTPLVGSPIPPSVLTFLEQRGGLPGPYLGRFLAAGREKNTPPPVVGGSLAVALLFGDEETLAAVGTITYLDGTRLLGFGHPFLQAGQVGFPIIGSRIIAPITDIAGPFKFATLGREILGTIQYDRFAGVAGRLGEEPELAELTTTIILPGQENHTLHHRIPRVGVDRWYESFLALLGLYLPVLNRLDEHTGQTLEVRTRMSFDETGQDTVDRTRFYSYTGVGAYSLALQSAYEYFDLHYALLGWNLTLSRSEITVTLHEGLRIAWLDQIDPAGGTIPGGVLEVRALLDMPHQEQREVRLTLTVPSNFPSGRYEVEVASDAYFSENDGDAGGETLDSFLLEANEDTHNTSIRMRLRLVSTDASPVGVPESAWKGILSPSIPLNLFLYGMRRTEIEIGSTL